MPALLRPALQIPTRFGESHGNAKLSEDDVQQLLAGRAAGASLSALAMKHGISKAQTARICRGEQWTHAQAHDDPLLQPLRVCLDPSPAVPPLAADEGSGARAFTLMARALGV